MTSDETIAVELNLKRDQLEKLICVTILVENLNQPVQALSWN